MLRASNMDVISVKNPRVSKLSLNLLSRHLNTEKRVMKYLSKLMSDVPVNCHV
jgi:hypothetical protein